MPSKIEDIDTGDAILLVPTAHVSAKSADRVRRTIERAKPDVVAVELDEKRLERFEERDGVASATIGDFLTSDSTPTGALLTLFHRGTISSLLNQQGLTHEDTDMFTAVRTARETETELALIDRPFEEMREEVVTESGVDELAAMLFVLGTQYASLQALQWLREKKPELDLDFEDEASFDFDPSSYDSPFQQIIRDSGAKVFSTPRDIILTGRNEYMVDNLVDLGESNDTIVCVIGGAHLSGMRSLLKEQTDKDILTVIPRQDNGDD